MSVGVSSCRQIRFFICHHSAHNRNICCFHATTESNNISWSKWCCVHCRAFSLAIGKLVRKLISREHAGFCCSTASHPWTECRTKQEKRWSTRFKLNGFHSVYKEDRLGHLDNNKSNNSFRASWSMVQQQQNRLHCLLVALMTLLRL